MLLSDCSYFQFIYLDEEDADTLKDWRERIVFQNFYIIVSKTRSNMSIEKTLIARWAWWQTPLNRLLFSSLSSWYGCLYGQFLAPSHIRGLALANISTTFHSSKCFIFSITFNFCFIVTVQLIIGSIFNLPFSQLLFEI